MYALLWLHSLFQDQHSSQSWSLSSDSLVERLRPQSLQTMITQQLLAGDFNYVYLSLQVRVHLNGCWYSRVQVSQCTRMSPVWVWGSEAVKSKYSITLLQCRWFSLVMSEWPVKSKGRGRKAVKWTLVCAFNFLGWGWCQISIFQSEYSGSCKCDCWYQDFLWMHEINLLNNISGQQ